MGAILLGLCSIGPITALANKEAPQIERTVVVIGEGIVEVEPDLATVRIGVESIARSVDEGLAETREIVSAMIDAFDLLGIDRADIQTANYGFTFDRSSDNSSAVRGGQSARAYRINNVLTVIIRDLEATPDIVDAAAVAGANQMYGVEFGIADHGPVERLALERASLDARVRALHLAKVSGYDLGDIIGISEPPGVTAAATALRSESVGSSGINPGVLSFSARLYVEYSLVSRDVNEE